MSFEWWMYVMMAVAAFLTGIVLNYIVKKINEVRLEERIIRLHNKVSQSTQVQRPLIEMETKTPQPLENLIANSNRGVSIVFNKEENNDDAITKESLRATAMSNVSAFKNSICESSFLKSASVSKSNIPRRIGTNTKSITSKETSDISRPKTEDIEKPTTFLGNIYKNDLSILKAKSKCSSLSSESSFKDVVDKIIGNMNESKSTPSIHKLYDLQNDKDMRRWISDIVLKSKCANNDEGTSSNK